MQTREEGLRCNFIFFAIKKDLQLLIRYTIEGLGFIIYEAYSRYNKPIRENNFSSNLDDFNNLQENIHFRGWCPEFNDTPEFEKIISAKPELFKERTRLTGPTLFQILENGLLENDFISPTRITAWTEKEAKWNSNYSDERLEKIDWASMRRKSRQIIRFIRVKNSKAKIDYMPIMNDALMEIKDNKINHKTWGAVSLNKTSSTQKL